MIFITQCDSPVLWQIYLSDPVSITMEGILIFNAYLLFLLIIIVLLMSLKTKILLYTIYATRPVGPRFSNEEAIELKRAARRHWRRRNRDIMGELTLFLLRENR